MDTEINPPDSLQELLNGDECNLVNHLNKCYTSGPVMELLIVKRVLVESEMFEGQKMRRIIPIFVYVGPTFIGINAYTHPKELIYDTLGKVSFKRPSTTKICAKYISDILQTEDTLDLEEFRDEFARITEELKQDEENAKDEFCRYKQECEYKTYKREMAAQEDDEMEEV